MRRVALACLVGLWTVAAARAEERSLDEVQLEADERALAVDPFAPAPLGDLVALARRTGQLDGVVKSYAHKNDAISLIVHARLEDALGHRGQAIELLRRAAQVLALPARTCARIGALLESMGALDAAIAVYDRALVAPDLPEAKDLALHVGELLVASGRLKEAEKLFADASRRAPNDVALRRRIADAWAAHGALKETIATLETARTLAASQPAERVQIDRRLGDVRNRSGDWRGAGAVYLEAWRLSDAGSSARIDLLPRVVSVYRAHHALDELAREAARGQSGWDHVLAGEVLFADGKKAHAAQEYQLALKRDPSLVVARQRLLELANAKDRVGIESDLVLAQPNNPAYRIDLGRILFESKRDAEAVRALTEAADRFRDAAYVQIEVADLLSNNGHAREALPMYERAVTLDANNPDYLRARAECYHQIGDRPKAVASYRALLGSRPTVEAYQFVIAQLSTRGYTGELVQLYREALTRYAKNDDLRRAFAAWLSDHGDLGGAIEQWKQLDAQTSQPALHELAAYQISRLERRRLLSRDR